MLYKITKITAWCRYINQILRTTNLKYTTKCSNLGKHKSSATNLAITLSKNQKNTQDKSANPMLGSIIKINASNNPQICANAYQSRIQTRIESGQRAAPKKIGENFSCSKFFKTKIVQWNFRKLQLLRLRSGSSHIFV